MGDRVKRILGFVLVATIDGPPGSPRQTYFPRTQLQSGFGDHYRWLTTSIPSVAGGRHGHRDSFPKSQICGVDSDES